MFHVVFMVSEFCQWFLRWLYSYVISKILSFLLHEVGFHPLKPGLCYGFQTWSSYPSCSVEVPCPEPLQHESLRCLHKPNHFHCFSFTSFSPVLGIRTRAMGMSHKTFKAVCISTSWLWTPNLVIVIYISTSTKSVRPGPLI